MEFEQLMANFITHGIVGAGIRAATTKLIGLDGDWQVWMANLGLIEGMAPDAIDWVSHKVFKTERWTIYTAMHTGKLRWLALIFQGMLVHLINDLPFHTVPGESWWPRLWYLEVLLFAVGLALLGWTFAP